MGFKLLEHPPLNSVHIE